MYVSETEFLDKLYYMLILFEGFWSEIYYSLEVAELLEMFIIHENYFL